MAQRQLTGTRIRERRLSIGVRQADLAARVGISGSYLNLIEHNRRRIAGKLVAQIAEALGVEPAALSEGAEADLITQLHDAWGGGAGAMEDVAAEEFAGRFPGWAGLLAERHRRVGDLERTVATLTDRLNHDPYLAAALHEMLTTVTAIRSTAGILAETREIEPQWQDRFHRNLDEDSGRLAQSARALAGYLEGAADSGSVPASPQEELEMFLAERSYHFAELEKLESGGAITALLGAAETLKSAGAQALARNWLEQYRRDAQRLSLQALIPLMEKGLVDPWAVAQAAGVPLQVAMRRMATLPEREGIERFGMVSCDAAGSFTFRKPLPDFPLPRHGAGCPLWPLYSALCRPLTPMRGTLELTGQQHGAVRAFAMAAPKEDGSGAEELPLIEAHMLLVGGDGGSAERPKERARLVGVACRICSKDNCEGRREPSILREGV